MALKVVSSYAPSKPLKVVNNYGMQGSTYNPQQTAPVATIQGSSPKIQQPTYNPQRAAPIPQKFSGTLRVAPPAPLPKITWDQAAIDRANAEAQIVKRRLADAKNNEIIGKKSNILKTLGGKISFEALRKQRGGRELAAKYWEENEKVWGSQLMSRQRNYENRGAQLKDWVMQATTEEDYNKRVADANKWLDDEYNAITSDIKDFKNSQLELANYAETPLKGKFATVGRFGKNAVSEVAGTSWNALTWTASQPQRAVNTVKNFVKPDNLRQYYGGEEKKRPDDIIGRGSNPVSTAWDQLRKSYNESRNQRTVGYSKDDEAERLKGWKQTFKVRMPDGSFKDREIEYKPDAISRFRIKYGDDVADMLLDPMNLFAGAGAAGKGGKALSKTDRLLKFLGKNKFARNSIIAGEFGLESFRNSKIGQITKKLGQEFVPRGERARDAIKALNDDLIRVVGDFRQSKEKIYDSFGRNIKIGNKVKSEFLQKQASHATRLNDDLERFTTASNKLRSDYVKRLEKYSDTEVRAMTRWGRNGKWTTGDKIRIGKDRRLELQQFVGDYQSKARQLAKSEGLQRRAKNYLPEFTGRGYDPTARRTLFGEKYLGQSRQQLQESMIMREFVSNWDESDDYLKSLAATEKAILRNAKKTNRGLTVLEEQQLALIKQRKEVLARLKDRFGSKFDAIRGAMDFTRKQAEPAIRLNAKGRKISTNFTKQGFKNTAADLFHLPMKTWKKSVLKYNPAWYVNNTMWNVPASLSAAGPQVFGEYRKLLTSRKYWNDVRKNLPDGVMSKISQEIGKGGLASKIEDTSRVATFLALRKKGFTDDQALKQVNRWLFDYRTKNWERPIKGVLPFWQWQKNLVRLGATMPFHSPRSAKVYSELYKGFYQRPYEQLPSEKQTYTDPETGKTVEYDPRKFYKGKAKVGDNWYGLPFFAVNPETMLQFGVNPYMLTAADYLTSSDRLGNKNTDRSAATILGERFPQVNLARNQANRNNMDIDLWFAESGNSKWAQGWDKDKSNYKLGLDNNRKFYNGMKSFFGVPRGVKFDKAEFDTKKRLTDFNKEFFSVDWAAKEAENYKDAQVEKEKLAKKFGFDLQKDIYDGYWSKYDTATTTNTKKLKREAAAFNSPDSGWWKDYFALPAGSKTSASERRPFLIKKFAEWRRDHTFAKNPYYKLPKNGEINPFTIERQEFESQKRRAVGKQKYARKLAYEYGKRTGDWSRLEALGGGSERKRQYDKAKKSGDWSYFDSTVGNKKSSPFQFEGKFFKTSESMDKYKRGALWKEYYALRSLSERQEFLAKHPEMKMFDQPTTQEEWDAVRAKLREDRKKKTAKLSGFLDLQEEIKKRIVEHKPENFGRRRTVRFKM